MNKESEEGKNPPKENKNLKNKNVSQSKNGFRNEKGKVISMELAKQIAKENYLIKIKEDKRRFHYENGIYKHEGTDHFLKEKIYEKAENISQYKKNLVIDKLDVLIGVKKKDFEEKTAPSRLLFLNNGIYDLHNDEFIDFSPDLVAINKVKTDYNPESGEPKKFISFLREITGNDLQMIQQIFEMIGDTLYRGSSLFKKGYFLYGPPDSGKTVLLRVIKNLIGKSNVSNLGLKDLSQDNYALAALYEKLANIDGDVSDSKIRGTDKFQQIVGGDTLMANPKHEKKFSFENKATMIFAGNKFPEVKDPSPGFWRRIHPIYRFKRIPRDERVEREDLIEELTADEELEGILNVAIKCLQEAREKKELLNEMEPRQVKNFWYSRSNSVDKFISQKIANDKSSEVTNEELWEKYEEFCDDKNLPIETKRKLGQRIANDAYLNPSGSNPTTRAGESVRVWEGIRIVGENEDPRLVTPD
ncbi:hypothetical protein C9439_03030 [archaeon SCG-AAA382B04]|nr:hypothetical protein C9439_03030 [archaeon SCG-AAA382B04]